MPTTRHSDYPEDDVGFYTDGEYIYFTATVRHRRFTTTDEAMMFLDKITQQLTEIRIDEVFGS
jgi:adenine specific DNA methylase Mod